MRTFVAALLPVMLAIAAIPACADSIPDLTFILNPTVGTGAPTNLAPDGGSVCLQPNCVLFGGALADTDNDAGAPLLFLRDLYVVFSSTPGSGLLTVDESFGNVDGILSGDPNWASDQSPFLGAYTGPIFGIDIAPGTTAGQYKGTAYIDACGGAFDGDCQGFTVASQEFIVNVLAPEPSASSLFLAGLLTFGVSCGVSFGVKRKWLSSEASR